MRIAGIICEYNPLHNGHARQIALAKQAGCNYVVCIMSGDFTQRGEPAIMPKWHRARMALLAGADMVLELPVDSALAPAADFAMGAVRILDGLGVVTDLCFGSETADLSFLHQWSDLLLNESDAHRQAMRDALAQGLSHPAAISRALMAHFPNKTEKDFAAPNDVLAVSYIIAIKQLGSPMAALPILRDVPHHQQQVIGTLASAGAIRRTLRRPDWRQVIAPAMPPAAFSVLEQAYAAGEGPVFLSDFDAIATYALRMASDDALQAIPSVAEGLHNRIRLAARRCSSIQAVAEDAKTKRYTHARIQRVILRAMLGLDNAPQPAYARMLGFRKSASALLAAVKQNARIPFFTQPASQGEEIATSLARGIKASDIYALALKGDAQHAGRDFTHPVIIV